MSKLATSIEQSKKLLELGLDRKKADMCYVRAHFDRPKSQSWFLQLGRPVKSDDVIGAWSLSALLELMPLPMLTQHKNGKWYIASYPDGIIKTSNECDNPLDVAFEMVCHLKENNLI